MRMSCNGCRVLRKGCSEDCTLRPCLQWIKSPESQANATLFLAKFYGRAGLVNLINAAPPHLHPELFRSLLYEACGRIINPVHGSAGLMSSGNWPRCQAAAEAVLQGSPLMMQIPNSTTAPQPQGQQPVVMPLRGGDIRHISKNSAHRKRTRTRLRRSAHTKIIYVANELKMSDQSEAKFTITGWDCGGEDNYKNFSEEQKRAPSHDSFSVETVEPALANQDEPPIRLVKPESEIGLDLTLRLKPVIVSIAVEISDSET